MKQEIRTAIAEVVNAKYGGINLPGFSKEVPENAEHGDYAANIALILGKFLGKNSQIIADELKSALASDKWRIESAGPGFLNFYLSDKSIFSELAKILKEKSKYGCGADKREKIQIEFISANPTGPLTLANGRGGFLGDVLSNILEFSGYKVEREYYINDTGNQIITLGKSLIAVLGLLHEEENFYKGAYIKKWAEKNRVKVKKLQSDPLKLGQLAAKDFLMGIKKAISGKAGIKFDRWTSEDKNIHKKGFVKKAQVIFENENLTYKEDGALWLKTTQFSDDKDRVLITSDGHPTYFMADAGHYLETKKRGFERKINILGPDHFGYVKRIQAVADVVGLGKSEIIVTQAIRLTSGGKEVKMSKRGGTFIAFEELIDEVGQDGARYFFLERSPDTHIDFDLDLAREQSKKNPVYYIQYAYARIASILRKAGVVRFSKKPDFKLLTAPEEQVLIKKMVRFPDVVADVSEDYQVHRLVRYVHEFAGLFHNFYERYRVITDDKKLTEARLVLVLASRVILKSALKILGIGAPDEM
ncbi:MAG: arginine--tRNA ligase [Patescibacteria group bacterium]